MSAVTFSSEVKAELSRVMPQKSCCAAAELAAVFRSEGIVFSQEEKPTRIAVALGHPAVARKVYRLLRAAGCRVTLAIGKGRRRPPTRAFHVNVTGGTDLLWEKIRDVVPGGVGIPEQVCCQRASLRGFFISRGSLASPEKEYHLEITLDQKGSAEWLLACLEALGLEGRLSRRKRAYVVYLKESEQIVEALKLMGASAATFAVENIRIVKGMRNRVNRLVNSETANVDKTVNAAIAQLDAIRLLQERVGLDALPEHLAVLARLRLQHPYASLRELGEMMHPKVTKSGVNYRMNRLLEYARKLVEADEQGPGSARRNILPTR